MSDAAAEKKRGLPSRVRMRHGQHFVEELAARSETPVGRMMPVSIIDPDPRQPRGAMGELDELVDSIRRKGVLEPISGKVRLETDLLDPSSSMSWLPESGPEIQ